MLRGYHSAGWVSSALCPSAPLRGSAKQWWVFQFSHWSWFLRCSVAAAADNTRRFRERLRARTALPPQPSRRRQLTPPRSLL